MGNLLDLPSERIKEIINFMNQKKPIIRLSAQYKINKSDNFQPKNQIPIMGKRLTSISKISGKSRGIGLKFLSEKFDTGLDSFMIVCEYLTKRS
jgi:hypothetical protein